MRFALVIAWPPPTSCVPMNFWPTLRIDSWTPWVTTCGRSLTFHHSCTHVARTADALDLACELEGSPGLSRIRDLFVRQMEAITAGKGIHLTQNTGAPEQGSYSLPSLGITIVPLVYGDPHSWNLAWLHGERSDVPYHLHREGVEIHLGYNPMHGYTVLGAVKAD